MLPRDPLRLLAFCLTGAAVGLIWWFRFLPLYDLPIWMYETRILQELSRSSAEFSEYYAFNPAPVPNLGLIVPLWLLSQVVSIEIAAKIYLSLCVLAFPWSFWYSVRSIAGREDAYCYMGFPYVFNFFVFSGQAYLLGLISLFLCTGYFIPRLKSMSFKTWALLFVCLQVMYFIHAISWFLALVVLFAVLLHPAGNRRAMLLRLAAVALPAVGLLLWYEGWYAAVTQGKGVMVSAWSIHSFARNLLKPVGLLIKSYGVTSHWPLTLINGSWVILLGVAAIGQFAGGRRREIMRSPFSIPALVCVVLASALGLHAFDVYQPGGRFVFPAFFLVVLTLSTIPAKRIWSGGLLAVCAMVCVYNLSFFEKVDARASELWSDIDSAGRSSDPLFVIALDWPADTGIMDVGSASVNPLSLVPYYARLTDGDIAWIFGTALVRLRPEGAVYRPDIKGENRREYVQSVVDHLSELMFFRRMLVVGSNDESRYVVDLLLRRGYAIARVRSIWTVLIRAGSGGGGNAGQPL